MADNVVPFPRTRIPRTQLRLVEYSDEEIKRAKMLEDAINRIIEDGYDPRPTDGAA
jgi:hypothetical protein